MIEPKQNMDMISENVTITNDRGLHARASSKFVTMVNRLPTKFNVTVAKGDQQAVGSSIMGLMMLGAAKGSEITISIEHMKSDRHEAQSTLKRLIGLVIDGFGED